MTTASLNPINSASEAVQALRTHAEHIESTDLQVEILAETLLASDLAGLYTTCDVGRTRKALDLEVLNGEKALDRAMNLFHWCQPFLISQDLTGKGAEMSDAFDRMLTRPGLDAPRRLRVLADMIEKTCLI